MVLNYAAIAAVSPIPFHPLDQDDVDHFDVFALGKNQRMQHKMHHVPTPQAPGIFVPPNPNWDTMGTESFMSPPSAVALAKNRVEVFALGTSSQMYRYSWSGGPWSSNNWQALGGHTFKSQPCTVALGTDHWYVFALDASNQVAYMSWNGATQSQWQTLSHTPSSTPSFASPPVALALPEHQRIEVFVLGTNERVYQRSWQQTTGWSPAWNDLGGTLLCPPCAVVRDAPKGAFDLFGLWTDKHIYHKNWDGQQWHLAPNNAGWSQMSGESDSPASGASLGPDHFITTVLQLVPNAGVQVGCEVLSGTFWLPSDHSWEPTGNTIYKTGGTIQFVSPPCALGRSTYRLDIFILSSDYQMYYLSWDGIIWQPMQGAWQPLGGQFPAQEVMGLRLPSGAAQP